MTSSFLERLVNNVIQASKRVKTETGLSSGATSVSFAAVQFILQNVKNILDNLDYLSDEKEKVFAIIMSELEGSTINLLTLPNRWSIKPPT